MKTILLVCCALAPVLVGGCAADDSGPQTIATSTTDDGLPIVVDEPKAFDTVHRRIRLRGNANVYEANVEWTINRGEDEIVKEGHTTAECGNGCRGDFETTISLADVEPGDYTLLVFSTNPENGLQVGTVVLPITVTRHPEPE